MLSGKFFAIASAILAAAVNASPVKIAKRDSPGDVYLCAGSAWGSPCGLVPVTTGYCYNFLGGVSGGIGSFGPNEGVGCTVYADYQCTGYNTYLVDPGNSQFSDANFGNGVLSFICGAAN